MAHPTPTYYLNGKPMRFADNADKARIEKDARIFGFSPNENFLVFIKFLEQNPSSGEDIFYVLSDNPRETEKRFLDLFKLIEAAGGLVKNKAGNLLMIFRNGKWDLPKGKLESGESPADAAIREVKEECGLKNLKIKGELPPTFHTYLLNEKRILKKTFWFEMTCGEEQTLSPQTEEGITEVKWMNAEEVTIALNNSYGTIRDVIGEIKN